MPTSFLSWLLSSASSPALAAAHGLLFTVPLVRLLESKDIPTKDRAPINFDGVPIQVVLARLNARRNLPMGRKAKLKPLADKGSKDPRSDDDRAEVKAVLREHGREALVEQKAYERAFWRSKQWNWRRVEKELRCRQLSWGSLAILAAEVGIVLEIAAKAA